MARASNSNSGVAPIPASEVAEILEGTPFAAPQGHKVEALDGGTVRSTNTVYEDRTFNPEIVAVPEPSVVRIELDGGTIMETYGPPAEADAESE